MKQIISQFSMNVQLSLLMAWLLLASFFIVLLPDGLAQSLGMLTLRTQLSHQARQDAIQKHSWEHYLSRLEKLFFTVIAGQPVDNA